MNSRRHVSLQAVLVVLVGVMSSPPAECGPVTQSAQRNQAEFLRQLDDLKGDSPNAGIGSQFTFEGSEDKGTAMLRLSNVFGSSTADIFKWSLAASAPFTGEEDEVQIGDLSGLSAGSTASLDLSWIRTDSLDVRAARRGKEPSDITAARIDKACDPYSKAVFGVARQELHTRLKLENRIPCSVNLFDSALLDLDPNILELREKAKTEPWAREKLDEISRLQQDYRDAFVGVIDPPGPLWASGIRLKATKTSFKYFLEADLAKELSDSKMSGSVGVYINRVYRTQLLGLAYNRVTNYEAGRKTQICTPIGTSGALDCSQKILGPPQRTAPDIISLEWRYLISPRTIAIGPIVEYDLDGHDWAARIPIYGAVNKDGDLVGGLSVNWDSKDDEVQGVVFFGKKFSLFD